MCLILWINTPYTLDIDISGGNNSCSLNDVAECSIILDKNSPPSEFLPDCNTVCTSGDTRIFSHSHPQPLITEHTHPFGLKNPKFKCFFNSVLQLIFSIFRNYSYTSPLNSSTEGTLLKCMSQTAHNACNSKDVDALKFQLVHHDIFYNGQNQQDNTECLLMLNIIDKGSMPDSSSTTSPTGASLSDILFSFVLEKNIVCDVCGLRSPSFESSSVLYILPTDTPSMQNLILEGLQQKLQKSCSRRNNNTWHIESSYILQPPKYLLLFVNRFRYLNNNITKDRCPIPLDTTVKLGPLKFNLQATIDHHGPSIDSGHYTASINCCKKTFYCNDHKIMEFGITDTNSSTAYIVLYKWIDAWFLDSNRRVGVWWLPWRWHILSIPLTTGRGTSAETCGLDDVFPPDDLSSRPEALCKYIYIYVCTFLIRAVL